MDVELVSDVESNFMPVQYQKGKCGMCRREGVKLFLKGEKCYTTKCPVSRRPYAPGMHGNKRRRGRLSDFGKQLREKQKAKRTYGLTEGQFLRYVQSANRKEGDTEVVLRQLLELRLDNVVYRLGLAASRFEARQRVSHAHIRVNGKKVNIPSYRVKIGDSITVKDPKVFAPLAKKLEKFDPPSWLSLDASKLEGKVVAIPGSNDFDTAFDTKRIIEFYSR